MAVWVNSGTEDQICLTDIFRDPELTEEVSDERGFFKTGDICEIDSDKGYICFD